MSVEEKKKLQGLRASYKLEEVLDFDGKTGEVGFWEGGREGGREGGEEGEKRLFFKVCGPRKS
jgi:hypothetical protein